MDSNFQEMHEHPIFQALDASLRHRLNDPDAVGTHAMQVAMTANSMTATCAQVAIGFVADGGSSEEQEIARMDEIEDVVTYWMGYRWPLDDELVEGMMNRLDER